jgi:predicted DNA-binding transcriptional regulator AlpA
MPTVITEAEQLELPLGGERFVRYPELKPLGIPFSRQHLTTLEAEGRFPRRVKLSERVIAWRFSEILEWMNTRGRE